MKERCRSTRFVVVEVLQNNPLAFIRKSINRGCGVADAAADNGRSVWSVLYEIDDLDIHRFDASEEYMPGRERNSYFRHECRVSMDGEGRQPLTVSTYFGVPEPYPPLPDAEDKNHILTGDQHWHLPGEYIRELQQIEIRA
jgi:hypothetical protein